MAFAFKLRNIKSHLLFREKMLEDLSKKQEVMDAKKTHGLTRVVQAY